jgi:hypothetical protein
MQEGWKCSSEGRTDGQASKVGELAALLFESSGHTLVNEGLRRSAHGLGYFFMVMVYRHGSWFSQVQQLPQVAGISSVPGADTRPIRNYQ